MLVSKITIKQVDYAIMKLKENEQITDYNITPRQLGNVLRDNNKTRK